MVVTTPPPTFTFSRKSQADFLSGSFFPSGPVLLVLGTLPTFLASRASNTVTKSASLRTTNPPVFAAPPAPPTPRPPLSSPPPSSLPPPPPLRFPVPPLLPFPPPPPPPLPPPPVEDSELAVLLLEGVQFLFLSPSRVFTYACRRTITNQLGLVLGMDGDGGSKRESSETNIDYNELVGDSFLVVGFHVFTSERRSRG